jgi:phosphohistidine phosphatase SixA
MKLHSILAIVFLLQLSAGAQNRLVAKGTVIYLVRHAEKESGNDPVLTTAGKQRAGDLLKVLKNKKLQRIYVTQFRRTQMTADSLRILLNIDTVQYVADTTGVSLIEKITAHNDFGKAILIIGHSNTVPILIKKLGVTQPVKPIADNEFDNLFVIKYRKGKALLSTMKYGAKPAKATGINTMQSLQ